MSISVDEAGRPTNLRIHENFLEFIEVTNQTGQGLGEKILNNLEEKGLMVSKCCSQGYDRVSNMTGLLGHKI